MATSRLTTTLQGAVVEDRKNGLGLIAQAIINIAFIRKNVYNDKHNKTN